MVVVVLASVMVVNLILVLHVVSNILLWDWELSSHEVDAIQTMKHKVWHGNDSNRAELVELFSTTTQHINIQTLIGQIQKRNVVY